MTWVQIILTAVSITGTIGLGVLTYVRGRRSDEALNIATNVKSTFEAQESLVDNLQEEVIRYRTDLLGCEKRFERLNADLDQHRRTIHEHEMTIAKHERTITDLSEQLARVSRRSDRPSPPRTGTEERRRHDEG